VASQRSKRKRRARARTPRAAHAPEREERAERQLAAERQRRTGQRTLGTVGERPEGFFGGVPVSELAILAGGISFVVGMIQSGGPALYVGLIVLALGVVEITAREHLSGYRSHTTLLAAIPTVALEAALVLTAGVGSNRALLLVVVVPVFALLFYLLRRRFLAARQARVARPPAP
jgi:Flp pilus assembly protein TadB